MILATPKGEVRSCPSTKFRNISVLKLAPLWRLRYKMRGKN
jgi:hypothetical protein